MPTDAISREPKDQVQGTGVDEGLGTLPARPLAAAAPGTEQVLAGVMVNVLGEPPIGRHDNFFARGVDSIKGVQAMARINQIYGLDLPIATLFDHPDVAALASVVDIAVAAAAQEDAALAERIAQMSDEEVEQLLREQNAARG